MGTQKTGADKSSSTESKETQVSSPMFSLNFIVGVSAVTLLAILAKLPSWTKLLCFTVPCFRPLLWKAEGLGNRSNWFNHIHCQEQKGI